MKNNESGKSDSAFRTFMQKHPVLSNFIIIIAVAVVGLCVIYMALAIFTKHGQSDRVPGVEKMSYTQALEILHDNGFRVDIRDSVYRDDVKPGFVIEQFPKSGSIVKPGRKIFLYINAVHPKEVVLDDDNHPGEYALKGESYRSAMAKLEELGFKNIRMVKVLGTTDRVVKVLANGRPVRKMQRVTVNSNIVLEVSDGRLNDLKDSLQNEELRRYYQESAEYYPTEEGTPPIDEYPYEQESETEPVENTEQNQYLE